MAKNVFSRRSVITICSTVASSLAIGAGLAALFQVAGKDARTAQARDLGFAIGPRINAAGRLTDMTVGIECLITDSFERATEWSRQVPNSEV